jgi:hypothetical protein
MLNETFIQIPSAKGRFPPLREGDFGAQSGHLEVGNSASKSGYYGAKNAFRLLSFFRPSLQ